MSIRSGEKSEKELILAELQSEKPIYFLYNGMLGVMTDENGLYYMRQRYYDTEIKRFINQDILVGSIDNSKSLNRYAYVQGNPINYNDPFGLNPLDILKPYANLMHGFLNIAGVLPGPLGYVADLMNAGVYFLEGNYKAAASMLIQSFNTFATGRIIGNLSRGSSKGRLLTSIFLAGTGATGIVSSGDSFLENAVGLVYSIANNKDADTVFSYLSGTICSAAGVYYGVKSFVGGYTMGSYALEGLEQEKLQKLHNTTLVERIFCYNSQCFVAGTLIKTPDGDKNIENISPGDKVYAYDAATGDIAEKEVVRTFEHEVYELYHVVIDGKEIVTTAEHPFYRVDKDSDNGNGFVGAKDLKPGDQILLLEGNTGTVDKVFKEDLTEPLKVYNFEVKDYHTYFVGEQGVLVHNSCKGGSPSGKVWDYSKQFNGELSNFNDGYNIYSVVDKDMYLVQFHSGAEVGSGRSLKYWTTIEEANGISTIDEYMDNMALLSDWGARDNVSIARIPAGTKIKYAVGTARKKVGRFETRPGGGLQILFERFNDSWVIDTRKLP